MIKHWAVLLCGLTLGGMVPCLAQAQTVTITSGDVRATIDSYGYATLFSSGAGQPNQLYEHEDFFSIGGEVMPVGPPEVEGNCTIATPISSDAPEHATSTVQCGVCTFAFDHTVDGMAGTWTTVVVASGINCTLACYYAYSDYDLFGASSTSGSYHPNDPRPQFVVHDELTTPDVHYTFGISNGPDHWQQAAHPALLDLLEAAPTCVDLSDGPSTLLNVEWTGAFQISNFAAGQTVTYVHGRDDSVSFP